MTGKYRGNKKVAEALDTLIGYAEEFYTVKNEDGSTSIPCEIPLTIREFIQEVLVVSDDINKDIEMNMQRVTDSYNDVVARNDEALRRLGDELIMNKSDAVILEELKELAKIPSYYDTTDFPDLVLEYREEIMKILNG